MFEKRRFHFLRFPVFPADSFSSSSVLVITTSLASLYHSLACSNPMLYAWINESSLAELIFCDDEFLELL
ncbi:hypothetical protein [Clostridium paridis]|uniref:Uncharacterized protein n=1 Tax=Clostridium paridis TaxID=2803863 RepID=A0A937FGM5_9CLOT|nr:hypothetical protein [Clostridium paridis]MBL4931668.1 hypothetical protein [Clostridium paridis]